METKTKNTQTSVYCVPNGALFFLHCTLTYQQSKHKNYFRCRSPTAQPYTRLNQARVVVFVECVFSLSLSLYTVCMCLSSEFFKFKFDIKPKN